MDAQVVLNWLREREGKLRDQLIKTQDELRQVTSAIRCVEREAARRGASVAKQGGLFDTNPRSVSVAGADTSSHPKSISPDGVGGQGVPLSERKAVLLRYLSETGPATRRAILEATAMPAGSLSALLTKGAREGWVIRLPNGTWGLALADRIGDGLSAAG